MKKEATFGAGCFWCIEACFKDVDGILNVVSGYSGGTEATANYKMVCTGGTRHAEVARIEYDDEVVSFEYLLEMFWLVHDPTQINRQGNDIGTQYRSVIFYHNEYQKRTAKEYKEQLDYDGVWDKPIVTQIVPLENFFPAEDYHKNYFEENPHNAYCRAVVRPKVEKFRKVFGGVSK
ncbi:MAG: peptide-methionine (S)-S-oxide reductase MsrA [Crocinitomicaceae bacterium]